MLRDCLVIDSSPRDAVGYIEARVGNADLAVPAREGRELPGSWQGHPRESIVQCCRVILDVILGREDALPVKVFRRPYRPDAFSDGVASGAPIKRM